MSLSNFQVFQDFAYRAATEIIDQKVNLFNTATKGGLVLSVKGNIGDFMETASFGLIAGMVKNRNAYGTGNLTGVNLAQIKENSVKIALGTDPIQWTGTSFDWIQRPAEEAGVIFGEQWAAAKMQYMLNTTLAGLNAAMEASGDVTYDGTAGAASLSSLNLAAGKMGDRRSSIGCWVMHSKSETDIYAQALANANDLFDFGTVRVVSDGHGRPLVVTDSNALVFDNAGTDNYIQLGLVAGSAIIDDNGDTRLYEQTDIYKENVVQALKAEASFNLAIKGFEYGGGRSPNDAAIALNTNWTRSVASEKDGPGVRCITL